MILNMRSTARAARLGRPLKDVDSAGQCLVLNTFFKIFPLLRAEKDKNSEAYRWAAALYREWTRPGT